LKAGLVLAGRQFVALNNFMPEVVAPKETPRWNSNNSINILDYSRYSLEQLAAAADTEAAASSDFASGDINYDELLMTTLPTIPLHSPKGANQPRPANHNSAARGGVKNRE
jgi:hypothetical protein